MAKTNQLALSFIALSLFAMAIAADPHTLVVPIRRSGSLVLADFKGRTPLVPVTVVVDVTARALWLNCETGYASNTFSEPKCGSSQCKEANTSYCHTCGPVARAFCHANTCGLLMDNPISHQSTVGEVAQDVLAAQSVVGSSVGPIVEVPNFLFTCGPSDLVQSGIEGAQGVLGLAQAPIAVQNQLASRLGIQPIFTMCIPSDSSVGPLFFGNGPYNFLPNIEGSKLMVYTPVTISPFGEYYVQLKSIKINNKRVPLNSSLFEIDEIGVGGTVINTLEPYTILSAPLYKSLASFYRRQLTGVPTVKSVAPFGLCFNSKSFVSTRLGPGPSIDMELAGPVTWSLFGFNALVEAKPGVTCLAFVDGGSNYRASVVIGSHQMQDHLVQVDLAGSRVGFSGSLLGYQTNCANFNFTSSSQCQGGSIV